MMALSPEEKRAMIAATYDAAKAMVDDLEHIRETMAKPLPTGGDLRRMSNLLRRLLIDNGGDLRKIAPPRLSGRLYLIAPASRPEVGKEQPWIFASYGSGGLFGFKPEVSFVFHEPGPPRVAAPLVSPPYVDGPRAEFALYGGDREQDDEIINLPLRGFLTQQVMYYGKRWISREEIIKYVANVASGVHSGDHERDDAFTLLHQARQLCTVFSFEGQPSLRVYQPIRIVNMAAPLDIDKDGVDFVLMQIMSSARYLSMSPDIIHLEEIIRQERRA
jgi:hypothetical protein